MTKISGIKITLHALQQYQSRIDDTKRSFKEIGKIMVSAFSERTKKLLKDKKIIDCRVKCKDFTLVIENRTIITVLDN